MLFLFLCLLGRVAADLRMAAYEYPGVYCMWPNAEGMAQFKDLGEGKCQRKGNDRKPKHWFLTITEKNNGAAQKEATSLACMVRCGLNPKCGGYSASRQHCLFWMEKETDLELSKNKWFGSDGNRRRVGVKSKPGAGAHCNVKTGYGTMKNLHSTYMIPSAFNYKGLEKQKQTNYDQFLRSNIDNEHDRRDFSSEVGEDALPFRTLNTQVDSSVPGAGQFRGKTFDLGLTVKPGESKFLPLRWNNPHSTELEVNIWIFHADKPVVVPVKKPTCSGEGYQDNIVKFTVPADFHKLGSKIPGFKGCNADTKPMCTLQIYSHSVESRTYAAGFPITILGHDASRTTSSQKRIQPMAKDPQMDLTSLRDLCLASNDPASDIKNAVPRWARLVSDAYNHAYQSSDFSPYSGQQHESISKNLQASAINKMVTGNRGELGRQSGRNWDGVLPSLMYKKLAALRSLESAIYRNYESLANKLIKAFGNQMLSGQGVTISADGSQQKLAECFRCNEVGSIYTKRLTTNTYIPSFQLPKHLVSPAKQLIPAKYSNLIDDDGRVQIYVAALTDLLPFFFVAKSFGIIYQEAMPKTTLGTMADATQFLKKDKDGKYDKGMYAFSQAKKEYAQQRGCPSTCLRCSKATGFRPLLKLAKGTCVEGKCSACKALFGNYQSQKAPAITILTASIVSSGKAPGGLGKDAIPVYPDADGSPRLGRPAREGEDIPVPVDVPVPVVPKPGAPMPSPGEPQAAARRRNSRRRRRSKGISRRRSPRRRRTSARRRGSSKSRRRLSKSSQSAGLTQFTEEVALLYGSPQHGP